MHTALLPPFPNISIQAYFHADFNTTEKVLQRISTLQAKKEKAYIIKS
jgi:hypothetical protein